MALPSQAIERLAQEPSRTPGWSSRLLMFSSTLFLISIFAYFGLALGYEPYLRNQAATLEGQAQALGAQVQGESQTKIVGFYSQLANLRSILKGHVYTSNSATVLERTAHPNIYLTKAAFTAANNQMTLSGVARSASDIPAQLQIFQNDPEVVKVTFNNLVALTGGRWQFDAVLALDPQVALTGGASLSAPVASDSTSTLSSPTP